MLFFAKNASFFSAALALLFSLGLSSCATLPPLGQEGLSDSSDNRLEAQDPAGLFDDSESAEKILLPERFEEIAPGSAAFTFKTSKAKAALYVNGNYHGLTPLKAAGLLPGLYYVQIKKQGYKTVNVAIQVKDGISDYYYIEMQVDDPDGERGNENVPEEAIPQKQSQETPEL